MKKTFTLFFSVLIAANIFAQSYTPSDAASEVKFSIKNFGISVTGSLKGLKGKIVFDPANSAASAINVTVNTATVNTGNDSRDKHLKKEDYFDVGKYPVLSFTSTKITGSQGSFVMNGTLTIKGISRSISFPFTSTAIENGYRLQGKFTINRRDFKVGGGSLVLSDELTVSLNVSAIK